MTPLRRSENIKAFYLKHLNNAKVEDSFIKAPCPFCEQKTGQSPGNIVVVLNPESFFLGYFRCLRRCVHGGFPIYFSRLLGIDPQEAPDFDPDRQYNVQDLEYPVRTLDDEVDKFQSLMTDIQYRFFEEFGVSPPVLNQMKIGYNGRYLVYPYILETGSSYAAHCLMPGKDADNFWHGNEDFFNDAFKIFNVQEIERCEEGTLFVTEGENNLLLIKELGYPGIAATAMSVLDYLTPERTAYLRHIFLLLNHSAESQLATRNLGTRLGFKVRIVHWPSHARRGYGLTDLAREQGKNFRQAFARLLNKAKAFSPFSSPEREHRQVFEILDLHQGKALIGFETGFQRLDQALDGVRGINIMGGPPKAGKSCFFLQVSTEMALRRQPVIYYDFENGRRKIYTRTLIRLSDINGKELRQDERSEAVTRKLKKSREQFKQLLAYFRVITDRKISPEIMRRHIDFLQHETRQEQVLVVVDSLHKLPFKDLGERRTGIDSWLRNLEAIRDELNVAFLVVSELSRGKAGGYDDKPDLGAFKESGDIEYSADNAMVLLPNWDPVDPISTTKRRITLWMVASRENSPGRIADYQLDYPYWRFDEL